MKAIIVVHYHEIGLKGKNRGFFEDKLIQNIRLLTGAKNILKDFGRLVIELNQKEDFFQIKEKLLKVFGISSFSFGYKTERKLGAIKKAIEKLLKTLKFDSFRITATRSDKTYKLSSIELNRKLGRWVENKTGAKVCLENPELTLFVEIGRKNAYLFTQKIGGCQGLPAGTAGKFLALISGGIDSPVAAHLVIKRGGKTDFIHFHSYPKTDQASLEKTKEIVKILAKFQGKSRLFLVPLIKLQMEMWKNCSPRYLTLLYRRAMLKIAQSIAQENHCLGLVTGESLGQVASQTAENLLVTNQAVLMPVYRPLIGFDKQEIIALAQKLGTYEISIRPHQDCCVLFAPKHPATKARLGQVLKEEEKVNSEKLIKEILLQIKVIKFDII